jgi:hypothetical protein
MWLPTVYCAVWSLTSKRTSETVTIITEQLTDSKLQQNLIKLYTYCDILQYTFQEHL